MKTLLYISLVSFCLSVYGFDQTQLYDKNIMHADYYTRGYSDSITDSGTSGGNSNTGSSSGTQTGSGSSSGSETGSGSSSGSESGSSSSSSSSGSSSSSSSSSSSWSNSSSWSWVGRSAHRPDAGIKIQTWDFEEYFIHKTGVYGVDWHTEIYDASQMHGWTRTKCGNVLLTTVGELVQASNLQCRTSCDSMDAADSMWKLVHESSFCFDDKK